MPYKLPRCCSSVFELYLNHKSPDSKHTSDVQCWVTARQYQTETEIGLYNFIPLGFILFEAVMMFSFNQVRKEKSELS